MKNIGIFGGGQLAKMIALEGYKMGLNFNIYDSNPIACAKPLADNFFANDYLDEKSISKFIETSDVFTYEFENIPPNLLEKYKDKIPQGVEALKTLQDRYVEKNFINELSGAKTVEFSLANENIDINVPFILKTRRLGYDGKGQHYIDDIEKLDKSLLNENYIIEKAIENFVEYSIIIGRNITGETYVYEPIKNEHRKGILYESTFAKNLDSEIKNKMTSKAIDIIEALNYHGVLCIEFFVKDNDVFVNEVAPRVHNSGHLTIEASNISQFKLHLLCILGMKAPKIECYDDYFMINILGNDLKTVEEMQSQDEFKQCNFHIYGKNSYTKNRKVGHITFKNCDGLRDSIRDKVVGCIK
ncbi:MAG: ATP-grasp domain-containing protein [Lachnospirales bacterium]